MVYDIAIIGSGPGGYVAAIRAAQLGKSVIVIEKEKLGGVCLNWGCIPTKALLKTANVYEYIRKAKEFGLEVPSFTHNFNTIISRSRGVADGMNKGIQFLFRKNKITHQEGTASIDSSKIINVQEKGGAIKKIEATNIIIATGARSRNLPNLPQDGVQIIGYREAMTLPTQPRNIVIVGSGAIGLEFAYFYNTIGTEVTIIEMQDRIAPLEDADIAKELIRQLAKQGIKVFTNTSAELVNKTPNGVALKINTTSGSFNLMTDIVLSAAGVIANTEGLGLDDVGIQLERGKIPVNKNYETITKGIYAIGDIINTPSLAHVASAEGIKCVEHIAGMNPHPINYDNIPSCMYASPEVASVGLTEDQAKAKGYELKIGKFPFSASGKASAAGAKDGFIKVIFDAKYGEWLGAHMIGANVTELIAEVVVARDMEMTAHSFLQSIHPHPTLSEALMEAVATAEGEVIHL